MECSSDIDLASQIELADPERLSLAGVFSAGTTTASGLAYRPARMSELDDTEGRQSTSQKFEQQSLTEFTGSAAAGEPEDAACHL